MRTDIDVAGPGWLAPAVISGAGLVLLGAFLWYASTFEFYRLDPTHAQVEALVTLKLIEAALILGSAATLLYTGRWLATSHYEPEHRWWVTMWCVVGMVGVVALLLLVQVHQMAEGMPVYPAPFFEELLIGAGGGGIAGWLIGLSTAQAMWRTDQVTHQRDAFAFLNKLLRHNVLNSVNIIQGKASLLADEVPDDVRSDLETIIDRSDAIATLTETDRDGAPLVRRGGLRGRHSRRRHCAGGGCARRGAR